MRFARAAGWLAIYQHSNGFVVGFFSCAATKQPFTEPARTYRDGRAIFRLYELFIVYRRTEMPRHDGRPGPDKVRWFNGSVGALLTDNVRTAYLCGRFAIACGRRIPDSQSQPPVTWELPFVCRCVCF